MSGVKFDGGKLRYDLLPVYPLSEVARVYTIGANKYGDRNWEKGIEWNRVYGALQRHANQFWGGESIDHENGQHHLAAVVFCAMALMEYEHTHRELDNRCSGPSFNPTTGLPSNQDEKRSCDQEVLCEVQAVEADNRVRP